MTLSIGKYIVDECLGRHYHYHLESGYNCTSIKNPNITIGGYMASNDWYLVQPPLPETVHLHLHKPKRYSGSRNNSWYARKPGGPYCTKTRCVKVRVVPIENP